MLGNLSLALFWCQAFENSVMSVFFIFLTPYPTEITIIYNLEYFLSESLAGFREKHLPVSLRNLSHSLNLIPFGAWGYPGPPGAFSLCFLSSRERASTSHPFSDFCRRFFFLLLAIPPVFGLSPFLHHFFPYSFLKKHFYTSHWNSLFYNEPTFFTLLTSSQKSMSLSIIPQWSWEEKKSMPCSHHLS